MYKEVTLYLTFKEKYYMLTVNVKCLYKTLTQGLISQKVFSLYVFYDHVRHIFIGQIL